MQQDKPQCQRTVRQMILANEASGGRESAIFEEVIPQMQVEIMDQDKPQCQRTVRQMILANEASGGGESSKR